ncbi:DUF2599 domain-containing protein [Oerskovia sp. M15]
MRAEPGRRAGIASHGDLDRSPPRSRLALVGAALAACLLVGCTGPDGAAPSRAVRAVRGVASSDPAEAATAEPAGPRMTTHTLTADGIELLLSVPVAPVTVTPDEDGSSRVSFGFAVPEAGTGAATGSSEAPPATATLDLVSPPTVPCSATATAASACSTARGSARRPGGAGGDGTVRIDGPRRSAGRGADPRGGAGEGWGATPSGTAGTTASAQPYDVTVTTWLGAQGVRSATWGNREGGRSLAVDPTPWARQSGLVGEETAWAQLVASEPEADTATMRDQFDCHALGATDKKTWNLEPWRPDVGFLATAAARCNPTA